MVGGKSETEPEPVGIIGTTFVQHAVTQLSGRLEILRIVHHQERLKRRVGPLTACKAFLARRAIEGGHLWWRSCALPESIKTAAVERLAMILRVLGGIAGCIAHGLPNARRLVRVYTTAAYALIQQAAERQGFVS